MEIRDVAAFIVSAEVFVVLVFVIATIASFLWGIVATITGAILTFELGIIVTVATKIASIFKRPATT